MSQAWLYVSKITDFTNKINQKENMNLIRTSISLFLHNAYKIKILVHLLQTDYIRVPSNDFIAYNPPSVVPFHVREGNIGVEISVLESISIPQYVI